MSSITYKDAGVDIEAGDALVERIKPHARRTLRPEVLTGIGGFGALVEISKKYAEPVLVSGTDGVGTKLKLAFELNRHDTVGIDLVAMCVNDILVSGAEPLFFLDYFATGRLALDTAEAVIAGIAEGCAQAGCALIGGETAEMPGMYPPGEYDLAGFAVGVAEKARLVDGRGIAPGDAVIGLASSGAHSNGYSLIRKLIDVTHIGLKSDFHGRPFADVVMAPTRIYVKPVLALMQAVAVKGMAHITGGGITGNLPRCLPDTVAAEVDMASFARPPLFDWIAEAGRLDEAGMRATFNCGVGFCLVVAEADCEAAIAALNAAGETAWRLGRIVPRADGEAVRYR